MISDALKDSMFATACARVAALEAENAALRERNEKLVEGLKPLAKIGGEIDRFAPQLDDEDGTSVAIGYLRRARALLQGQGGASPEVRVEEWVLDCFGPEAWVPGERAARVMEETIELAQACGVPEVVAQRAVAHVYSRPVGDPHMEAGAVALCLYAWAAMHGTTVLELFRREMGRVDALPREKFRARWAEKKRLGMTAEGQGGSDAATV